jgi:hypothetical protein
MPMTTLKLLVFAVPQSSQYEYLRLSANRDIHILQPLTNCIMFSAVVFVIPADVTHFKCLHLTGVTLPIDAR